MSADDYELAADDLARRCLAKFDDEEASPELRAFALGVVVSQVSAGNLAMLAHVPDICRSLKEFATRMRPITGTGSKDFYRQITDASSMILGLPVPQPCPADAWLTPLMQYFVQLASCRDVKTAKRACEFWSSIHVIGGGARCWATLCARKAQLARLLTSLIDQMIFRDDVELSSFESLCRKAEAAFQTIVGVCPRQLICKTLIPLIEARTESDSWAEKEAAIRALHAFTNAVGE